MKEIIFIENHKNFNGARLGVRLARVLGENGRTVILAGRKGKLAATDGVETITFAPSAKASTLAAAFKKIQPNRVIALASVPACEAAAQLKVPFVYVEPENFKEEKAIKNKKDILKKAKKVVVIGEGEKPLDKKHYGANAVRVKNPALAIAHNVWEKPACFKKQNNIVAVGPLSKEGGMDELLKIWADLAGKHPTWHLTVYGDGSRKLVLRNFITRHHLQDSVEFVSTDTALAPLLRAADIYVHPAKTALQLEDLVDAMASKLPVLAANLPEVADYITHDVNGLLAPVADEQSWGAALDKLMVDWGKRVGLAVEAEKMKNRLAFEVFACVFED